MAVRYGTVPWSSQWGTDHGNGVLTASADRRIHAFMLVGSSSTML